MGTWSEKQFKKQEAKEKDKIRKENLAKYFFDLSKLSFAGLVIGVVIPLYGDITNENNWYSICTGLTLTILSALFANKILKWIMDALGFIFTVGIAIVGGLYLWTYTKSGKKWLENL